MSILPLILIAALKFPSTLSYIDEDDGRIPIQTAVDEDNADENGADENGADEDGADEDGADEDGADEDGADEDGADEV